MSKYLSKLIIVMIFLFVALSIGVIYIHNETRRCGDDVCEVDENPLFCPQDCKAEPQPLNAIGKFSSIVKETGAHNIYLLGMNFRWNGTAYIQGPEKQLKVALPKTHTVDMDRIYDIAAQDPAPDIKAPYYADTIEAMMR